jgi:hypothetical protein
MNSTFCSIGKNHLLKLGGVDSEDVSSDYVEVYNIVSNSWAEIDPTIEHVKTEFSLLSCSGWATLNDSQVFIFGGYNQ